jgi:hypothetical protein
VAVVDQGRGCSRSPRHSISVLASLGYHDFEGPALRDDEKPRLVDGSRGQALPHSPQPRSPHGRGDGGGAFVNMYYLETSCAIQVRAQSGAARSFRAQGSDRRLLRADAERGPSGRHAGRTGCCGRDCCVGSIVSDPSFRN